MMSCMMNQQKLVVTYRSQYLEVSRMLGLDMLYLDNQMTKGYRTYPHLLNFSTACIVIRVRQERLNEPAVLCS